MGAYYSAVGTLENDEDGDSDSSSDDENDERGVDEFLDLAAELDQ